jgi:glycine cleavage system H protein
MSTALPTDRQFTSHDEWVQAADDVLAVGITDFAQDALGEIVHVELPEVGDTIDAGEAACEIESVKAVAEIYAPVTGEIVAVNEALEDEPELLNSAPYGTWIFKLKATDEVTGLLDAAAYQAKIDEG